MNLVDNWAAVLKHAWSYKFAILAALLSGVDVGMQILASVAPSPWIAAAAGLAATAAAVSRFVYQPKVSS